MSTVGDKIRELRKWKSLTQQQLADASGVSVMSIRRYESGERKPSLYIVKSIADALEVRIEDIVGLETFDTGAEFKNRWKEITSCSSEAGEQLEVAHRQNGETVIINYTNHDKLLNLYDSLNPLGKSVAIERLEELAEIPKYQKEHIE